MHSRWALTRALICRSISPKYFFTEIPQCTGCSFPPSADGSRKPAFTRIETQWRVYYAMDKPVKRRHPANKCQHIHRNQICCYIRSHLFATKNVQSLQIRIKWKTKFTSLFNAQYLVTYEF